MRNTLAKTVNYCFERSLRSTYRRFAEMLNCPAVAQENKLAAILEENGHCEYVQRYQTKAARRENNVATFRQAFPIVSFDDVRHWTQKIKRRKDDRLTNAEIICWEPTSGSSQAKKWVPYTKPLLDEFNAAINPWLASLYRNFPEIRNGRHYWSVSMANRDHAVNDTEIPLGLPDDSHYLGLVARLATRSIMSVPSKVKYASDDATWRRSTALYLLRDSNLTLFSVWSPTFLLALCDYISENQDELMGQLPQWRRRQLKSVLGGSFT